MAYSRYLSALFGLVFGVLFAASGAQAAPYAAMVMDARTGDVLHSRNADTRLHPASLTKMMTLYIAFEAVRLGEISMDSMVTISQNAAAEPPSKLGLRAGQQIRLRYLVRAAAVRSANDAATAIGEAIEGSEAAFSRRMNRTAEALGMTRTTFRNAHGLTQEGHLSTARDMTILGRRMVYDYPQYYNLFSRLSTDAGVATVRNTNRAFLAAYRGADGIKTGYTRAAGFNLVASAERNNIRVIATVFGGQSTAWRNQRVMELLDMGFARAPARAELQLAGFPVYTGSSASGPSGDYAGGPAARTLRPSGIVTRSLIPQPRPSRTAPRSDTLLAAIDNAVQEALAAPVASAAAASPERPAEAVRVDAAPSPELATAPATELAPEEALLPSQRPVELAAALMENALPESPEIVTRATSSGERLFAISLGRYPTQNTAERLLLQTALSETLLQQALRHVTQRQGGFEAQFAGMTEGEATRACARLIARDMACMVVGP